MIEINFILILGLAILSMVLGAVWYGPLFGRTWCRLNGVDPDDVLAVKEMGKGMAPVYLIQFVTTLFMVFVVYVYTKPAEEVMNTVSGALWLWAGIVVPILASAAMWTSEAKRSAISRFLIQAGYYLVLYVLIGFSVMYWG